MPKKFATENPKAATARARKTDAKNKEKERVEREKEDAKWVEDDKNVLKKLQKKEDEERKRQEALQKKQEKAKLYEDEMNTMLAKPVSASAKVTRAQIDIQKRKEQELKQQQEKEQRQKMENIVETENLLCENVNQLVIEGEAARCVDEAITVLTNESQDIDRHPEKRLKAAYIAFEDRRLAALKIEKPTLRLSQLKQLIKKEWLKSPENPLNKRLNLAK